MKGEFESPVIRAKITPDMVGGDCLLMTDEQYNRMQYGAVYNALLTPVPDAMKRSLAQLGTYWACCHETADNTEDKNWNTPDKVDEQCKIAAKHYEYYIYYQNQKTGEQTLHIKTRSIAFRNLDHINACGYFTEAFQTMADRLGMTVDEMVEHVKAKMKRRKSA